MKPVLATAPIDLSLTEEESGRGHSSGISTGLPIGSSTNTSPITRKIVSSPVESADLLYEYFPLSLDDWSESCAYFNIKVFCADISN